MITDNNWVMSDNQSVTSTVASTNVIDTEVSLDAAGFASLGGGTPLWVILSVHTSFGATTSTSNQVYGTVEHCATSGGTYVQLMQGRALSAGYWSAGQFLIEAPLPLEHMRYIRTKVWTPGASVSSATVDSYLALNAPRKVY